jgi:hypothetical protein
MGNWPILPLLARHQRPDDAVMDDRTRSREELTVDRAIYEVDRTTGTYQYLRRNPVWPELDPADNESHKRSLDSYTRVFPDGRRKVFAYRPPYTWRRPDGSGGR